MFVFYILYFFLFLLSSDRVKIFDKNFVSRRAEGNRPRGVVKAIKNGFFSFDSTLLFLSLSLRFSLTTPLLPIFFGPSEDKKINFIWV